MAWIKRIAFFSTLAITVVSAIFLARLSEPKICNSHPSILNLSLFSGGKLKSVKKCSVFYQDESNWSNEELQIINNALKMKELESDVILTIDMDNRRKFNSVLNYFWIGKNYFYHPSHLSDWMYQKSFEAYKGKNESQSTSRILNALSAKVFLNKNTEFNWSQFMEIENLHLHKFMLNKADYCKSTLLNLNFVKNCKLSSLEDKKNTDLFIGGIEALVANILATYVSKLDITSKLKFLRSLKLKRKTWNFPDFEINESTYSEIVLKLNQYCSQIIKIMLPDSPINQLALAKVLNEKTLFSKDSILLVDSGEEKETSYKDLYKNIKLYKKYLRVDPKGFILTPSESKLNVALGDLFFYSQVFIGSSINLKYPIIKKSKFVYLIEGPVDFKQLLSSGVGAYLLNNSQQRYALLHTPSLLLAGLSNLTLSKIDKLNVKLGWQSRSWSQKEKAIMPRAQIEGVLKYRLATHP